MQSKSTEYMAGTLPSSDYAFYGLVYLSSRHYAELSQKSGGKTVYLNIKDFILKAKELEAINEGTVGLSSFQRQFLQISKIDKFPVELAKITDRNPIDSVELEIDMIHYEPSKNDNPSQAQLHDKDIVDSVKNLFKGKFINYRETFPLQFNDGNIIISATVKNFQSLRQESNLTYGILEEQTEFNVKVSKKTGKAIRLDTDKVEEKRIFKKNFNFQELGIGGLDKQFEEIFRRAFNSRRYPQNVIEKYGIKHVRGMLLYGPPGTGKTLIARQIAKALDCEEPKIVNGPEIFSKYVGEAEKKIRELFADAERDMKAGDESKLHIIIFDEIDAICRQRGSVQSGTGVNETVVNQLLSKMDGVDSLNNILVIGMTNRKDMIDEAMLRPGRLEIHLEIGLPDEYGRKQIFEIHTRHMKQNNLLADDVNFDDLSARTKNYTGAEIEAVCRGATSFALFKDLDMSNLGKVEEVKDKKAASKSSSKTKGGNDTLVTDRKVTMADFEQALEENKPAFGVDNDNLTNSIRGGFYPYGETFNEVYKNGQNFLNEIKNSQATPLLSILLEGKNGSGKTALAAKLALESTFPFVKLISPENFVGYSEAGKISQIVKIFEDAYKSPLSLIILDDIERLIEFIHIGPRFSNAILQTLLVLIKKKPPNPQRKLMIIGTTSLKGILQEMEVVDCFNVCMNVPSLKLKNEFSSILSHFKGTSQEIQKICQELTDLPELAQGVPIKNMILSIELAIQNSQKQQIEYSSFMDAYKSVNHYY